MNKNMKKMVNFHFKIKLNNINNDIGEIKNGQKSNNKNEKLNDNNTYFQTKRKNCYNNNFINNDQNYSIQKNKSETKYLNFNYIGRMTNHIKPTNFNLTNINIEAIPKNTYITKFDSLNINNNIKTDVDDIIPKKNLTKNYINDCSKNITQKYKTSSSSINVNENKYFLNHFKKNTTIKNLESNDNFYKNSLYYNYCHKKNNLSNNNLNTNYFNSSKTRNNCLGNNTFNDRNKNFNSIPSLKYKKIKKIIDKRNIINSNTEKNLFKNKIIKRKTKKKNINNLFNYTLNNHERKTIDLNYDFSFNNTNIFKSRNINLNSNPPVTIKTKSNNINNTNPHKVKYNKIEENFSTLEDITIKENLKNSRNQEYVNIKNPKNESFKFNRKLHRNFEISTSNLRNNYLNTEKNINSNKNFNTSIDNKYNHEQMLLDLIDIINQYNNRDNKVNMNNIIDEYKSLIYNFKLKNEFIYKIIDLYNNLTKSNLNFNDSESLLPVWKWIRDNQNKIANNISNKNEENQYKNLCKDIMKQYNLKNIQQLKKFIGKLCKKVDNNENFFEGIRKILLP